jgi:hypothetical protein
MKSLESAPEVAAILARLHNLREDSPRQWGTMTVSEMLCHLTDSFRGPLGEKELRRVDTVFSRTVMKFVALHTPMRWPKGLKTMPEMDPKRSGTKPTHFAHDRAELEATTRRFLAHSAAFLGHPLFGEMSLSEWKRWAYLHLDHHFRQFGV